MDIKVLYETSKMIKSSFDKRTEYIDDILHDADIIEEFDILFASYNKTQKSMIDKFNSLKEDSKESEFEEFFSTSLLFDKELSTVEDLFEKIIQD
jgi:hypothetical protein